MSRVATEIVDDVARLERVAGEWEALLARSDSDQATLSPLWTLAWWRVFGGYRGRRLRVALVREGGRLVGLAPLLLRWAAPRPGVPVRRLEPLASGEAERDEICSDYLGVIAERGREQAVALELARLLRANAFGAWDELVLPSMSSESVMPSLLTVCFRDLGDRRYHVPNGCPYIPLGPSWDDYLERLSPSSRYKVRRSLRAFDRWAGGDVRVRRATTAGELEEGNAILRALHGERWTSDGQGGVFASAHFRAFHDEVMPALLDRDALDLVWIEARGRPVAALYNIVWGGKVQFYQSGRAVDLPAGVRAGLVGHAHAIQLAIARGCREYDFLAGCSPYKLQLALAVRPLGRVDLIRSRLVARLRRVAEGGVDVARAVRRRLLSAPR